MLGRVNLDLAAEPTWPFWQQQCMQGASSATIFLGKELMHVMSEQTGTTFVVLVSEINHLVAPVS